MNRRFANLITSVFTVTALMAAPAAAGTVTRFSDDMESGPGGWTATGFWNLVENPQTIQVFTSGALDCSPEAPFTNDISPDLVTLPDADSNGVAHLPAAASGTHAWWYGVSQNGTFIDTTFPNGVPQGCKNGGQSSAANGGALTSSSIDLTGLRSATLHFKTWFEIESVDANAFDLMTIEVSTDSGTSFVEIGKLNPSVDVNGVAEQPFTSGGYTSGPYAPLPAVWVDSVFSLDTYVDQHVMIRFTFASGDTNYNGFRGWLIDDVKVDGVFNDPPVANNDTYSTNEDTALAVAAPGVLGNDSDPNEDPITAILVTGPQHAVPSSFALSPNGSFTYTPAANFNGTDSFTYKANDGKKDSNTATVTITVTAVNDPPAAAGQSVSTAEDTAVLITLSGSDIDSTSLTFSILSGPSHGGLSPTSGAMSCTMVPNGTGTPGATCTAGVIYTPAANYFGPDSFMFNISDGSLNSTATVSITVSPVNDAPVLTVPGPMTVNEGTSISFTVSATDVDGPFPLIFSVSNLPSGATLTPQPNGTSAVFTWTPNSAQGGPNPYFVQFTVSDGQLSDTKVVSITVNDTIADRDGDGVPDAVDNCPDDPNATQVDVCHNSPQATTGTQTVTRVDGTIPVTFIAMVTNDKTDISFLPPSLFTVNCQVINNATGMVVPVGQFPESGPFVLNLGDVNRPGDLVKVAAKTTATFTTTFDLRIYYPGLANGSYTTICTYVQFGQILNPTADDPPLWTGEIQAPPQTIFVGQYQFIGFFSPLPGAKFSQTNTVPVKFALKDSTGAFVTNATCTLTFQQLDKNGNLIGSPVPATPTSGSGNQFKYDFKNNQYVFTVASGSLPVGPVQLQANLHDGSAPRTVNITVTR